MLIHRHCWGCLRVNNNNEILEKIFIFKKGMLIHSAQFIIFGIHKYGGQKTNEALLNQHLKFI